HGVPLTPRGVGRAVLRLFLSIRIARCDCGKQHPPYSCSRLISTRRIGWDLSIGFRPSATRRWILMVLLASWFCGGGLRRNSWYSRKENLLNALKERRSSAFERFGELSLPAARSWPPFIREQRFRWFA